MSKEGKGFFVTAVLLCMFTVGAMIWCSNINSESSLRAEDTQAFKLEFDFEPKGTGIDLESPGNFIYRFSAPNENIVVYKIDEMFIVGTDNGKVYGNLISTSAQFLGLSSDYLLLLTNDGVTAFNFPFVEGHNSVHSYEVLSDEEQGRFIFPCSYEKIGE